MLICVLYYFIGQIFIFIVLDNAYPRGVLKTICPDVSVRRHIHQFQNLVYPCLLVFWFCYCAAMGWKGVFVVRKFPDCKWGHTVDIIFSSKYVAVFMIIQKKKKKVDSGLHWLSAWHEFLVFVCLDIRGIFLPISLILMHILFSCTASASYFDVEFKSLFI